MRRLSTLLVLASALALGACSSTDDGAGPDGPGDDAGTDGGGTDTGIPGVEQCANFIDDDGDGAVDCLDTDCAGHADCGGGAEVCGNTIDDDGDGAIDCDDSDCATDPACDTTTEPEICGNTIDDDGDGATDCDDSDCADDPLCDGTPGPEICDNGSDDDGDGSIDCDDSDCARHSSCEDPGDEEDCDNGTDDDGDEAVDCDDLDCIDDPACDDTPGPEICDNGTDDDDDLVDCDDDDCARHPDCVPAVEVCDNEIDDDGDDLVDCADGDCEASAACEGVEFCANGTDDDDDEAVDCADDDCADHPACSASATGDLELCDGMVDTYLVTVGLGGAVLTVDTVAEETTFDPLLIALVAPGDYVDLDGITIGFDDEIDCAFPPADFRCPQGEFEEGVYEVVVGAASDNCAGALQEYALSAVGAATFEQVLDNRYLPITELDGEVTCDDDIDNDGDGAEDCEDDECAELDICEGFEPEICDDDVDNDGDEAVDCEDDDCVDDPACEVPDLGGELVMCDGMVDTWLVTVDAGGATLTVDTVADETAFDPYWAALVAPGDYEDLLGITIAFDDDVDCTFPPPSFTCPQGALEEGVYEIAVGAASVIGCAGEIQEYLIVVDGAATLERVLDNRYLPITEFDGEVTCDDELDNDGDGAVDCEDDECGIACPVTGAIIPCTGYEDEARIDAYEVTVGEGGATFRVDTLSADTTFDPWLGQLIVPGDYSADTEIDSLGDDDFECTFPPVEYECPEGTLEAGAHEILVGSITDTDCADPEIAEYELTFTGVVTEINPTLDDFILPVTETEETCGDLVDNDIDGLFDCDDDDCADLPPCRYLETIEPCDSDGADFPTRVVDTWLVEIGPGGATLSVDTLSADTTFDPRLRQLTTPGDYSENLALTTVLGDDNFECAFPPPLFSCPETDLLEEGTYEVIVESATTGNCTGDIGEYEMFIDGDATGTLTNDDVILPF